MPSPLDFSLDPFKKDVEERNKRLRTAESFKEADRVPVAFSIGGSYYCWMNGYDIGEYYANPEMQIEAQLKGLRWLYEDLRADSSTNSCLWYEIGPIQEAIVFGADIERPAGTSPRIVHKYKTVAEAAEKLSFPAPADNPRLKQVLADGERFKKAAAKMGAKIPAYVPTNPAIHPPLSCLCALVDPAVVYEAMYEEPETVKAAMEKCFAAYTAYYDLEWKAGGPNGGAWMADDNCCFISAELFREFEMPYYHRIKERYKPGQFHLHTDGPSDHLFKTLATESGITQMDIGGFSKLENAVRDMKGKVYISGGLNCKDFFDQGPMPEETRKKALRAIKLAAPGGGFNLAIGGETYVGTSPQGICELVRLVEERGKYPISISDAEIA